jgi:hypothetical protein
VIFREDCGYESAPVDPFVLAAERLCGVDPLEGHALNRPMHSAVRMAPRDAARLGLAREVRELLAARMSAPGRPGCGACGGGTCLTPDACARLAA